MEELSQLGCVGSGNNLQRQKKSPWILGERKQRDTPKGRRHGWQETVGHGGGERLLYLSMA